jgi:hypothetical protein
MLAGRRRGWPSPSKPSNTIGLASSGRYFAASSSGSILPCSMSCMQAVAVKAFVMDNSQNTVSARIVAPVTVLAFPKVPS